jgi:hypothetical protein
MISSSSSPLFSLYFSHSIFIIIIVVVERSNLNLKIEEREAERRNLINTKKE